MQGGLGDRRSNSVHPLQRTLFLSTRILIRPLLRTSDFNFSAGPYHWRMVMWPDRKLPKRKHEALTKSLKSQAEAIAERVSYGPHLNG